VAVRVSGGSISPPVHATNHWGWTEGVGEVCNLRAASLAFLASAPAGS
jgi:hypothetical protein